MDVCHAIRAGGVGMYIIDNKRFGHFVSTIRKEKTMTQRELGERLFVSDKTVSKWERGLSLPNVELLFPLAEVLEVSLEELFCGIKKECSSSEEVIKKQLSIRQTKNKKKWMLTYGVVLVIFAIEMAILLFLNIAITELKNKVFVFSGLLLVFGGWFVFFMKNQLPGYYDENKISYVTQGMGVFRIHLPGITFNNSNWPVVCNVVKGWTLLGSIFIPLLWMILLSFQIYISNTSYQVILGTVMLCMVLHIYVVSRKFE